MTQEEENIPPSVEDVGDVGRLNISCFSEGNIPSPYQPENPIMSEFKETAPGSGHWYARSGGPPKNDWSGLDDTVETQTSFFLLSRLTPRYAVTCLLARISIYKSDIKITMSRCSLLLNLCHGNGNAVSARTLPIAGEGIPFLHGIRSQMSFNRYPDTGKEKYYADEVI